VATSTVKRPVSNAETLAAARLMYRSDRAGAIRYLEQNGDPSDAQGYVDVREQIRVWKEVEEHRGEADREAEAHNAIKRLIRDWIEQWKNHLSDEDLGRRGLEILEKYGARKEADGTERPSTLKAMELANSPSDPYPKLRALMEKAKAAKAAK
jgi:hypothetical protein